MSNMFIIKNCSSLALYFDKMINIYEWKYLWTVLCENMPRKVLFRIILDLLFDFYFLSYLYSYVVSCPILWLLYLCLGAWMSRRRTTKQFEAEYGAVSKAKKGKLNTSTKNQNGERNLNIAFQISPL